MPKRLLSVGNCSYDDSRIKRMVGEHFDAEIMRASGKTDATEKLGGSRFDLILINRTLGGNPNGGVELIRQIKSAPELANTPVMLLSNYPDCQTAAIAEGAEAGFGKSELDRPSTVEKLRGFLS
ncbi:MAG: hypothetical protein GXY83_14605 [Rhodopirellula sp.]|nr:hypothetical protein [Rhodopirellula sp.]